MAYDSDDFWSFHNAMNKAASNPQGTYTPPPTQPTNDPLAQFYEGSRQREQARQKRRFDNEYYTRDSQKSAAEIRAALLGIPVEDIDPVTGDVATPKKNVPGEYDSGDFWEIHDAMAQNKPVPANVERSTDTFTPTAAPVTPAAPATSMDTAMDLSKYLTKEDLGGFLTREDFVKLMEDKYSNPFAAESAPPKPVLPPYLSGALRGDPNMLNYLRDREEEQGQAEFLASLIRHLMRQGA